MVTDDAQSYGRDNPFFIRKNYRNDLRDHLKRIVACQHATDGEFIGKLFALCH